MTATTNPVFRVHMEPADRDIVWWAETDAVAGLSIAAPTLMELRTLIEEAVARHIGPDVIADLDLVDDEEEPEQGLMVTSDLPALPTGTGVRKVLIPVA